MDRITKSLITKRILTTLVKPPPRSKPRCGSGAAVRIHYQSQFANLCTGVATWWGGQADPEKLEEGKLQGTDRGIQATSSYASVVLPPGNFLTKQYVFVKNKRRQTNEDGIKIGYLRLQGYSLLIWAQYFAPTIKSARMAHFNQKKKRPWKNKKVILKRKTKVRVKVVMYQTVVVMKTRVCRG